MAALLDPPVYSPELRRRLMTVSEAIDYIDTRLSENARNHPLVQAARLALYRAEDGGALLVSSHKLACALLFTEINRG
jgi:hypothetical protein